MTPNSLIASRSSLRAIPMSMDPMRSPEEHHLKPKVCRLAMEDKGQVLKGRGQEAAQDPRCQSSRVVARSSPLLAENNGEDDLSSKERDEHHEGRVDSDDVVEQADGLLSQVPLLVGLFGAGEEDGVIAAPMMAAGSMRTRWQRLKYPAHSEPNPLVRKRTGTWVLKVLMRAPQVANSG